MKPSLLILLVFSFISPIFSQVDLSFPEGEFGVDYCVSNAKGKQGLWIRVYDNGRLYYKGNFKDDVPQGKFYFCYDSGELMTIVDHLEGKKYVHTRSYTLAGDLMSDGHYREMMIDGTLDKGKVGKWTFYDAEGRITLEEEYEENLRHGSSIAYYATGKVAEKAEYFKDKKNGPWIEYFPSGMKKGEGVSVNGSFNGKVKYYHPDGTTLIQGEYKTGLKDGVWIKFLSNGKIEVTTKYELGEEISQRRENGEFIDYYPSGIPQAEYEYADGMKNGPFKEFYDQGEWVRSPIDEPMPGGGIQFKEDLEGDQMSRQGDFLDDKLDGEVTYFDENGRITKIEYYVDGILESVEEK